MTAPKPAKAEAPPAKKNWFLSDGTPYKGEDFRDPKGKPFGEMDVACGKCRGSGKRRFGRKFGRCQACDGDKTVFTQVRIYSEAEINRKEKARMDRRAVISTMAKERRAAGDARWSAWCSENAELVERARETNDPFIVDVLSRGEVYGSLTEPQTKAVRRKIAELDAERRACIGSRPVAAPGVRQVMEVTCRRRGSFMGKKFGRGRGSREVFVTEMVDDAGNALICISDAFKLEKGDRASINATVKTHDEERKAWPVTVLTRIKILRHDPAPVVAKDEDEDPYADYDLSTPLPPLAPGEEAECVDHGADMNLPF
jgi:hypothetical protein